MTAISADTVRRFDAGRVVRATFGVLRRNASAFCLMTLLLYVIPQLMMGLGRQRLDQSDQSFSWLAITGVLVGFFGSLIGGCVLQAALTQIAFGDLNGRDVTPRVALQNGLRLFWPLLGMTLLAGLGIGLALLLLVIPGFYVLTMWSVALPAMVVERLGINESFNRSQKLTRGSRWPVFGLILAIVAGYIVIYLVVGAVGMAAGAVSLVDEQSLAGQIASALSAGLGTALMTVGGAALYTELRSAKEGDGADQLASVFD